MERYGVIHNKNKREILLLKAKPCKWGKCAFCDYIEDNSTDESEIDNINALEIKKVTGIYGKLEVINSGSAFELTGGTKELIRDICLKKGIKQLFLETHYMYKDRLSELRDYFGIPVRFKCGVETFDGAFRNGILRKNVYFASPSEVASYMDSICLMVGVKGQTKEMIARDIDILLNNFKSGCINVYTNNSTGIKSDGALALWFRENYGFLENMESIDVLWKNTDFGVGSCGCV